MGIFVDKPLATPASGPNASAEDPDAIAVEIDVSEPEEEEEPAPSGQSFDDNLAKHFKTDPLNLLGMDISQDIEQDCTSRKEWTDCYENNIKYLGIKTEPKTQPWAGCSNVVVPMMLEAIVRFQSRGLSKLFPTNGPAVVGVRGVDTNSQIQLAMQKAQNAFNDYVQIFMPETLCESDRLLYSLAEVGYAVKKVYFDKRFNRTFTQLVRAEDFIMPYGFDNLATCPRFTQMVRRSILEVKSLQADGSYLDDPLMEGPEQMGEVEQAKSRVTGQEPSGVNRDADRFYECYVDLFIEEDEFKAPKKGTSPYVVTIQKGTDRIFAIKRNWDEQDPLRLKRVMFIPYLFVPGDGSYGYGIIHLVGQINAAAYKVLNQLLDAGTMSNLPALFRSRAARMSSQAPIAPGEIREVGLDPEELQKAFFPLPFKEPSLVLLQLLQELITSGKSFSGTADLDISASSQNAPVGTTLALLERQLEIQNAVQKRLHTSFGRELNLIKKTMAERQQQIHQEIFGELEQMVGAQNISLVPAGDATSSTLSQRIITLQAIAQQAVQAPQVYDLSALHRSMAISMGISDANVIVPDRSQIPPMSLVEENMALMTGKPVRALPEQDQLAHVTGHMALMQDPKFQAMYGQSPMGAQFASQIEAHIADHLALQYRNEIQQQLGVQLPPQGQQQPPQVDAILSSLVAQAAKRVQQQHASEAQQMKAQQMQADPAYQLEQQDLQIKNKKVDLDHQAKMAKLTHDTQKQQDHVKIETYRIATSDQQASESNKLALQKMALDDDRDRHGMASDILTHLSEQDQSQTEQAGDLGQRLLDHGEHLQQLSSQGEQQQKQHAVDLHKHHTQLQSQEKQHQDDLAVQQDQHQTGLQADMQKHESTLAAQKEQAEIAAKAAKNKPAAKK